MTTPTLGPPIDPTAGGDRPAGTPPASSALLRAVVDHLADAVCYASPSGSIEYWNEAAERLTGYRPEDVIGRRCHACVGGCSLAETLTDGHERSVDTVLQRRDGTRLPVSVRTTAIRDERGSIIGATEVISDGGPLRDARRDALTDSPTGLANRRRFDQALEARVENMRRYGAGFGLLVIDVDRFKSINRRYGHAAGDEVLRLVADAFLLGVRAGDLVARWGGDEFAVIVEQAACPDLTRAAERLRRPLVGRRVMSDGRQVTVRISIGGAAARSGDTADTLFRRADAALFAAKDAGGNRSVIVDGDKHEGRACRHALAG